jgi:CheY-like chemotaxis protein
VHVKRPELREALETDGYVVLSAGTGRDALDVLATGVRPSVILLDLMMPVMSGWQVLDALGSDSELAALPVVVMSAAAGGGHLPGAWQCISKPVELGTLLAAIEAQWAPRPAG